MRYKITNIILLLALVLNLPTSVFAYGSNMEKSFLWWAIPLLIILVSLFIMFIIIFSDGDDDDSSESDSLYDEEEYTISQHVRESVNKPLDKYKEEKKEYVNKEKEIQLLTEKAQDLEIQALQKRIKELEDQLK